MSNTFQTNTFVGGMNMDIDATLLQSNQYSYSENTRIITDQNSNTGALHNVGSIMNVSGGDFIGEEETVLATSTINDYGVIFTVDKQGLNRIYRIKVNQLEGIYSDDIVVIVKGYLAYTHKNNIKIILNFESDQNIKMYFTDGVNPIRTLNIMSDSYIYREDGSNTSVDSNGILINNTVLDINPGILLQKPKVLGIIDGGQLQVGTVAYCYQLYSDRGLQSPYSQLSQAVSVFNATTRTSTTNNKGVLTTKAAIIEIPLTDNVVSLYDKCRIIRITYNDKTETPKISVVDSINISSTTNAIQYTDKGTEIESDSITIEELNVSTNNEVTAATLSTKDNIMFAANIQDVTWKPEYDARAYRFTKYGKLLLNAGNASDNIDVQVTKSNFNSILSSIPEDHDCICPYNTFDDPFDNADSTKYNIEEYFNNKNTLGGSGINVSYTFITLQDISLCSSINTVGTIYDNSVAVADGLVGKVLSVDNREVRLKLEAPQSTKYISQSYKDSYISSKYKGYHRDEIYRFGIVFYNYKSIATPVYWIADIKFPHFSEAQAYYLDVDLANSYKDVVGGKGFVGYPIGINFYIKNFPAGAVAYEIVRCERTRADRTVLAQCALSTTYTRNGMRIVDHSESWQIKSDKEIYPMLPLGVTNATLLTVNVKDMWNWRDWLQSIPANSQKQGVYVLISSEMDFMGYEQFVDDMKGSILDLCCWLDTRVPAVQVYRNGEYGPIAVKYFNTPNTSTRLINEANNEVSTALLSSYMGSSAVQLEGAYNVCIATEMTSGTQVVSPLWGMHFVCFQRGTAGRRFQTTINEALVPPVAEQEALAGGMGWAYRNIGPYSYLPIGCNNVQDDFNWQSSKVAYFGNSALISTGAYVPRYQNVSIDNTLSTSSSYADYYRFWNYTPFLLPIFNIKRKITPYGGNTYLSRNNSTYISTGVYNKIEEGAGIDVVTFGGDTYLTVHDHKTTNYIRSNSDNGSPRLSQKISVTDYIPFESTVNDWLQYGQSYAYGIGDSKNVFIGTTINSGTIGTFAKQERNYYAYNDAFAVENNAKFLVPDSATSISNLASPNKIIYSETKTPNELSDSWTVFKPANYTHVDSYQGPITNLITYKDKLYFFQDTAVGIASVNDRSLISDNNVSELVLGSGGVLDRYDYITTENGSSVVNDPSIVTSDNALYWYDTDKNELCALSDGVHKLSKEKSVQTFLNQNRSQKVHDAYYDNKFNEVCISFDSSVIVYNEYIQNYTSFYTYNPNKHLEFSNFLVYVKDNKLTKYSQYSANKNTSIIRFVVNANPLVTKTFDNVFFSGQLDDVDMITSVKFSTKTQTSTIFKEATQEYNKVPIDYREDTYRFAIGREDNNEDPTSYPGRLKGKYLICEYKIQTDNAHQFSIPNINTTYRSSLV